MHGTLWHEWWHKTLIERGVPFFHELNLTPYMPEGWSGTADWVFWHPEYQAFALGDLKTAKGEAIYWINSKGAKTEHIWQLSAYYYALLAMGLPMVKGFAIMYWPMNDTADGDLVLPTLQECDPLPEDVVLGRMVERWSAVQPFLGMGDIWETAMEELAPEQDREQKLFWNKTQGVYDLKLVPHWSTRFCDWSPPLCSCSLQGTTKIGHYKLDEEYVPRKGYEDIAPTVAPTVWEYNKRRKETA